MRRPFRAANSPFLRVLGLTGSLPGHPTVCCLAPLKCFLRQILTEAGRALRADALHGAIVFTEQ